MRADLGFQAFELAVDILLHKPFGIDLVLPPAPERAEGFPKAGNQYNSRKIYDINKHQCVNGDGSAEQIPVDVQPGR
ncbi:hypothetical protein D3C87_1968260 [compost metagenome]